MVFDAISSGSPVGPSLVKLLGLYLGMGVLTFVSFSTQAIAIDNLSLRLRIALFEAALLKDLAYFERNHGDGDGEDANSASAALGIRMDQDVQQATKAVKHLLSSGVQSVVTVVGGCMAMVATSGQLSAFMLLSTPVANVLFTSFAQ